MQVGRCVSRVKCLTRDGIREMGERMDGVGLGKNEGEDGWGGLTKTKEI